MSAFLYREGDTLLHRVNPVAKFVAFSVWIVVPTLFLDPATPAAFLILSLLLGWTLGRISPLLMGRRLAPFLAVAAGMLFFNAVFYGGAREHLLFRIGPLGIWSEGVSLGASVGLRIICIASYSALFIFTTDPTRFASSLTFQAGFHYRLSYAVLAAYRFLPLLQRELNNIRDAHAVRGAFAGRSLRTFLARIRRYGVPLLAGGIRQAERLAIAMDARGFGALPSHTFYVRTSMRPLDYLFVAGALATCAGILWGLAHAGLLRGFLAGVAESIANAGRVSP